MPGSENKHFAEMPSAFFSSHGKNAAKKTLCFTGFSLF
jgi:hypothetical protein